ncbi:HAD family hydrolase [Rhodovulum euryhalinum]|uniref:phosphoglycolate phosphatase n=1 Tax=Rhodovulum euryhalinum TaxID=35805 RepID=A0A4V2SB35_9RHOB|nr:HAD family hydrolase [Rhodovulum euryhalinum]TCO73980.1 phosphoglycolate phosphatase [Rhodovulum euryhalinum]
MARITAILFDKDGTLFDFHTSWGDWATRLLEGLAGNDGARHGALAEAIGFDRAARRFRRDSVVIASTAEDIAMRMLPHLPPDTDLPRLVATLNAAAAAAPMQPAVPLQPLLEALAARGLALGVATNDAEHPARAHLVAAGIADRFDFVAGYDSGHGAKPDPGQLLAFAVATGRAPAEVLMVGDSRHDLSAGRRAGMATVAVLTGAATAEELADLADAVLPNIGHLPDFLDRLAPG